jgi:hypothetical protein
MTDLPPRLESEERMVATSAGEEVQISIVRRGILKTESKTYKSARTAFEAVASYGSPRQSFEKLCESLRCRLESSGLPSDRQKVLIEVAAGQWEPFNRERHPISPGSHLQLWISRLYAQTEPLSHERSVGDYLYALTRLLDEPGAEPLLWYVGECINAAVMSKLAGPINLYATAGIAARRGRAAGPRAQRVKAAQRRQIIAEHVQSLWIDSPILKGDAINSAAKIASAVNGDLIASRLLTRGKSGLSVKTIGDHIRALISAKKL